MSPLPPRVRALAALVVLVLAALYGHAWTLPPAPAPASAPASAFSAARAGALLADLAQRPHRVGSAEHARVRGVLVERLRALGLDTSVQETIAQRGRRDDTVLAVVRNIVAVRKGTGGGAALLLVAHYDTRSMTPGASDDGYGVAALLEAMRALGAEPLARDVLVLLSDGEEEGLLGARAFVAEHPLARRVGMVVNLEARGNAGAALMFQTSDESGALVRGLGRAVSLPAANALSQAIYRRMPNDTDLSAWLPRTPALNFANIGGFERYHAPTDTVANLDAGTLQQHGEQVLAVARTFASLPLPPPGEPDPTFFDAGTFFVQYPGAWALPLAGLAAGLLVVFLVLGAYRRALHPGRAALALLGVVAAMALTGVIVAVVWQLVVAARPDYALVNAARPLVKGLYLAAFLAVAATLTLGGQALAAHRLRAAEAFAGAAAVAVALAVLAALYLPGGAFLFTWPALSALLVGIVLVAAGGFESDAAPAVALQLALPVPAFIVVAPFVTQLYAAFGPDLAFVPAAVAALLAALASPALRHLHGPRSRAPLLALLTAGSLTAIAGTLPPFDAGHPRPDTLIFTVDADAGRAAWVSPDRAVDAFTERVLAHAALQSDVPLPFPLGERVLVSEVARVDEPAPTIEWLEESGRTTRARVVAPPGAELLAVRVEGATLVRVAGRDVTGAAFRFHAPPPAGVEMELRRAGAGPVTVRALSQRPGFPEAAAPQPGQRPAAIMARPGMMPPWDGLLESDMTLVARTATR
jgi:hypothetical protein